MGERKRSNDGI
jgi:hypothetical protein